MNHQLKNYICSFCNKKYETKWEPKNRSFRFCSKSCANKFNPRRKLEGICKTCKNPCHGHRSYCSVKCYQTSRPKRSEEYKKLEMKRLVRSTHQRLKQKAIDYKGGKCQECEYNKCNAALTFHHINPEEKSFTISGKSISWERIKVEIDKCLLLCFNCHAELHSKMVQPKGLEPMKSFDASLKG